MRILLVEQNPAVAAAVSRELTRYKMTCDAATPATLADMLQQGRAAFDEFDAIVTGSMDDAAGRIMALRRQQVETVIVCLLDHRCVTSTIDQLRAGADDVMVKPVNGGEIAARIEATRRRAYGHATAQLAIGRLTVYLDGRDPEVAGRRLRLSHREHAIFTVLALNVGRVVSKERIYESVYGLSDSDPLDKVIDVYICKLRKKIAESTDGSRYIETVYGRGYKLQAPQDDAIAAAFDPADLSDPLIHQPAI